MAIITTGEKAQYDAYATTKADKADTYTKTEIDKYSKQQVVKNLTVDSDYTLTADENLYGRVEITDTGVVLTAARNVILDNVPRNILVINSTVQILTFKTSAGTGIAVLSGESVTLYNDGTNVIVLSKEIGINQTLTIVTGSRALGVVYTNSTDTSIEILASISYGAAASAELYINGVNRGRTFSNATASIIFDMVSFIVKPGDTYEIRVIGGTVTILAWNELR